MNFGGGGVELQVQDLSLACRLGVLGDKPPADSARPLAEKAGERQKVRSLGLRLRRRRSRNRFGEEKMEESLFRGEML